MRENTVLLTAGNENMEQQESPQNDENVEPMEMTDYDQDEPVSGSNSTNQVTASGTVEAHVSSTNLSTTIPVSITPIGPSSSQQKKSPDASQAVESNGKKENAPKIRSFLSECPKSIPVDPNPPIVIPEVLPPLPAHVTLSSRFKTLASEVVNRQYFPEYEPQPGTSSDSPKPPILRLYPVPDVKTRTGYTKCVRQLASPAPDLTLHSVYVGLDEILHGCTKYLNVEWWVHEPERRCYAIDAQTMQIDVPPGCPTGTRYAIHRDALPEKLYQAVSMEVSIVDWPHTTMTRQGADVIYRVELTPEEAQHRGFTFELTGLYKQDVTYEFEYDNKGPIKDGDKTSYPNLGLPYPQDSDKAGERGNLILLFDVKNPAERINDLFLDAELF